MPSYRSTARYEEDEKTLLFFFLSEEVGILKALQGKKIDSNPGQSQENCPNSDSVGHVFFFLFVCLFFAFFLFFFSPKIKK